MKKLFANLVVRFTFFGFCFGLFFPLIALNLDPDPKKLFLIIWTTPIFLGASFYWLGKSRENLKIIQESDKRFENENIRHEFILEGAGLGSWDWWLNTNEVHFDKRWLNMLGLEVGEVPNQLSTWDSRVHPEDKETCYRDIKKYLNGETPIYENVHRLRHKNGSWVWILDRGRISERDANGKALRFTGTHLDITHYKNQEKLSNDIQKMAKIGAWEMDVVTNETLWTDEIYNIYGWDNKDPSNLEKGISFYAPEDQKRIFEAVQNAINGKAFRDQFEFIDAKGVHKWVESTGEPVKNADGAVVKLRGTFQDISEKVLIQKELLTEKSKLAHKAKLASLGEMAAGVAHEINNPLAIIGASTRLLEKYKNDPQKFEQKIEVINRSVDRIANIVNGLRKFSRTKNKAKEEFLSVERAIEESITIINIKAERNSVPIHYDASSDFEISCDSGELVQVLVNLLGNAIDAVSKYEKKWVRLEVKETESHVVLRIVDSGNGISKEIEEKLFQPFFTTKPVGEGTGLGLSISKEIITQNGGELRLNGNSPNTCFEICFPKKARLQKAG